MVDPKISKMEPQMRKRSWGGPRPNSGGRRPGSGRKKGTPNKVTAEIKELAQKYGPEAIAELARLATKAESEAARVAAIRELLDRGYGRAVQPIEGSVTYGVSQPCGNANSHLQSHARAITEPCHGTDQCEPGAHGALGIVLVCLRIAEVNKHAVTHVSGDDAIGLGDLLDTTAVECADDVPELLGIEPGRQRGGAHQIAKHDRELAPLRRICASRLARRCGLVELGDRAQYSLAMPERDPDLFQVRVG